MKLQRIQTGAPFLTTDELKMYLQFSGSGREDELIQAIEAATTTFENKRNVSLRCMTIEQVSNSDDKGMVQLYYPQISEVVSVVTPDQDNAPYTLLKAMDAIWVRPNATYVVTYKTEACDNASAYKSAVVAMAALIFDGNTDAEAYQTIIRRWA